MTETPAPVVVEASEPIEPVLDLTEFAARLGAAVAGLGGVVAILVPSIGPGTITALGAAITAAVTAVVALVVYLTTVRAGQRARTQVTPLARPRSADGEALVPVSELPVLVQELEASPDGTGGWRVVPQTDGVADHGEPDGS